MIVDVKAEIFLDRCVVKSENEGEVQVEKYIGTDRQGVHTYEVIDSKGRKRYAQIVPMLVVSGFRH